MKPFGDKASISEAKLTEYILSPTHRIGANKARVFKSALGIGLAEVAVLRSALLDAARTQTPNFIRQDKFGEHYAIVFKLTYGTKSAFVRSLWVIRTGDDVAKFVSAFGVSDRQAGSEDKTMTKVQPTLLDAVALLSDQSDLGLVLGQVGTVVELFVDDFALVEFCDRDGATFSMPTLPISSLLRLSYEQVAA